MLGMICLTKQLCVVYLYRIQPLNVDGANENSQGHRHRLKRKQRRALGAYAEHTFLDPTSRHHKGENALTPMRACTRCSLCLPLHSMWGWGRRGRAMNHLCITHNVRQHVGQSCWGGGKQKPWQKRKREAPHFRRLSTLCCRCWWRLKSLHSWWRNTQGPQTPQLGFIFNQF